MHVEEVIIKPLVAGRFGAAALVAVAEKTLRGKSQLERFDARHPAAFDGNRIHGQCESHDGDAARRAIARRVGHQTVGRIHYLPEVIERGALDLVQKFLVTAH
jgi:hypothetical protein